MNISSSLPYELIPQLSRAFNNARPILFTGAGFSAGAANISGNNIPLAGNLTERIWSLLYGATPLDPATSLQDIYANALRAKRNALSELLRDQMTVDSGTLPGFYERYFSFPWQRIYTLNIDTLEAAAEASFSLPRKIISSSAVGRAQSGTPLGRDLSGCLEVIHLNGALSDVPDGVTFSMPQYGSRLASPDPWYTQIAAELASTPFIFVGTELDEPPLWQYISMRGTSGSRENRGLRPRSYLVTPSLNRARRDMLQEHHITWVPLDAAQFEEQILSRLDDSAKQGHSQLQKWQRQRHVPVPMEHVADLIQRATSDRSHDFLLGHEPTWQDLLTGRTAARTIDEELFNIARKRLEVEDDIPGLIVITGTAGSGKSASLMRLCLRLSSELDKQVGWIDRESETSPQDLRREIALSSPPDVIAIDDADRFGRNFPYTIKSLSEQNERRTLQILALRSTKTDRIINRHILQDIPISEYNTNILTNHDIDGVLGVLEKNNRLGVLRGQSPHKQRRLFSQKASRQLLVAMIETTSGKSFDEKIESELRDLHHEDQLIYGLVAVAHNHRFWITPQDALIALGEASNELLNRMEALTRRGLLDNRGGRIQTRHRVVAAKIEEALRASGEIFPIVRGLSFLAATQVLPTMPRSQRPWRMLASLINHNYLERVLGTDDTVALYDFLEDRLPWDHLYWLQRGSHALEFRGLDEAENYLAQAYRIEPSDYQVASAWAHLRLRVATNDPKASSAADLVFESVQILEGLIESRGEVDPYPFHILGNQGLSWARDGTFENSEARERFVSFLLSVVEKGVRLHPREPFLSRLLTKLRLQQLDQSREE
jgi:hypothetical protein